MADAVDRQLHLSSEEVESLEDFENSNIMVVMVLALRRRRRRSGMKGCGGD